MVASGEASHPGGTIRTRPCDTRLPKVVLDSRLLEVYRLTSLHGLPSLIARLSSSPRRVSPVAFPMPRSPAMADPPLHTSFERVTLHHEVAHGGQTPILTRRVWEAREVPACNFVDLTVVPAGGEIGIHTHHTDNEEIYVVVSGRAEMHVDGATFEVGAGHVVVNRPGGTHALRNPGPDEVRLVVIEVPLAGRG